jgi:hypothetical protein
MKEQEIAEVAAKVAFILKKDRDDRVVFTDEEAQELKDLARLKKNTIKAVIWIGGILVALALKDIWSVFWAFITGGLSSGK